MGLKSITIQGNVVKAPEKRKAGETKICTFTVAVDSNRPKKGEEKPKATYFRVSTFGRNAEQCAEYLEQGQSVCVVGDVELNVYENEGKTFSNIEVTADRVHFGPKKKQEGQAPQGHSETAQNSSDFQPAGQTSDNVW